MSFSKDVKKEILDNKFASREQCLAFLCGLLYSSAEYEINDNNIENFIITTDVEFLFDYIKEMIETYFGEYEVGFKEIFKIGFVQYYQISLCNELAKKVLLETTIAKLNGDKIMVDSNISETFLNSEENIKGFMAGVFIGCGTSSILLEERTRTSTGYHLEIANQNYELLHEASNILAQFEILAKLTKRKSIYVLYIKDAEEVSNVLALMGASDAVLKLQNEIITRQVRNKINRQNNCYTSNYNKTLNASYNQLQAINIIDKEVGIYNLPEDLLQVALLRLANTEESLEELLKLSKTPLTKSALNHKFQKLIKMSEKLKGKK